ncbi:MAG: alpha/beta fold hydrolase [Vampirovibrionales bacterium]|nr:alpha/beta fold hydrolase [Vampirovibrionales bacterium]
MVKQKKLIPENGPYYVVGYGEKRDHLCLMLHGLGGDCYELSPLAKHLHQQGYSVLGVRYPGHGGSAKHLPHTTWQQWASHTLEAYQQVADAHTKVSLVGFSTGGTLAVYLSQHMPVHRLILLAPFFGFRHFKSSRLSPKTWLGIARLWVKYIPAGPLPIACPVGKKQTTPFRQYRWFSVPIIHSALELIEVIQPLLSKIDVPVLAVFSPKDAVVCSRAMESSLLQMTNTTAQRHKLSGGNHIVCRDVSSDAVNTAVLDFLTNTPHLSSAQVSVLSI